MVISETGTANEASDPTGSVRRREAANPRRATVAAGGAVAETGIGTGIAATGICKEGARTSSSKGSRWRWPGYLT